MDNGKLQAEADDNISVRTSRIRLGIERKLNTAQFENVVISHSVEEDVTWSDKDIAQRDRKLKNWETVVISEFMHFHDRVLQELKLEHKVAYLEDPRDKKDYRPKPGASTEWDLLDD